MRTGLPRSGLGLPPPVTQRKCGCRVACYGRGTGAPGSPPQPIAHLAYLAPLRIGIRTGPSRRPVHPRRRAGTPGRNAGPERRVVAGQTGRAVGRRAGGDRPVAAGSPVVVGTAIGRGPVTNSSAGWLNWQGYLLGPFVLGGKEGARAFAGLGILVALGNRLRRNGPGQHPHDPPPGDRAAAHGRSDQIADIRPSETARGKHPRRDSNPLPPTPDFRKSMRYPLS